MYHVENIFSLILQFWCENPNIGCFDIYGEWKRHLSSKKELHKRKIKCQIKPRSFQSSDLLMKIDSRGHRFLINNVKRNTKIDGMGPFKSICFIECDYVQHMSLLCYYGYEVCLQILIINQVILIQSTELLTVSIS